jgi:hypothetical protein
MAIELVTGHSGAAHVSGADAGAMHAGICGSDSYVLGAVPSVTMSDANTLVIQPCDLMVEGRHVRLSGTNTLSIRSGAQTGKRNDLVYVRYTYDSSTGTESAKLGVKEGTTATTATDPALDNPSSVLDGATIADVAIARVSLDALTPTATWLLPQLPTLKALGDSTKFERLYDDDESGWHIWHMGKLVTVSASGVVIAGSGSWDKATCPYTIPDWLRPAQNIVTGGMSRDGALSTLLYVNTDGTISINNAGGAGKANVSRYASLTYMAG